MAIKQAKTNKISHNIDLNLRTIQLSFKWIKLVLEWSRQDYNNHNISNNAKYHNQRIKAYQKEWLAF